jgi:hypothetical protein
VKVVTPSLLVVADVTLPVVAPWKTSAEPRSWSSTFVPGENRPLIDTLPLSCFAMMDRLLCWLGAVFLPIESNAPRERIVTPAPAAIATVPAP